MNKEELITKENTITILESIKNYCDNMSITECKFCMFRNEIFKCELQRKPTNWNIEKLKKGIK